MITTAITFMFLLRLLTASMEVCTISGAGPCGHLAALPKVVGRFLYVIGTN